MSSRRILSHKGRRGGKEKREISSGKIAKEKEITENRKIIFIFVKQKTRRHFVFLLVINLLQSPIFQIVH